MTSKSEACITFSGKYWSFEIWTITIRFQRYALEPLKILIFSKPLTGSVCELNILTLTNVLLHAGERFRTNQNKSLFLAVSACANLDLPLAREINSWVKSLALRHLKIKSSKRLLQSGIQWQCDLLGTQNAGCAKAKLQARQRQRERLQREEREQERLKARNQNGRKRPCRGEEKQVRNTGRAGKLGHSPH